MKVAATVLCLAGSAVAFAPPLQNVSCEDLRQNRVNGMVERHNFLTLFCRRY